MKPMLDPQRDLKGVTPKTLVRTLLKASLHSKARCRQWGVGKEAVCRQIGRLASASGQAFL